MLHSSEDMFMSGFSNKTFGEKKILLFTDNDDPHKGDVSLEVSALNADPSTFYPMVISYFNYNIYNLIVSVRH